VAQPFPFAGIATEANAIAAPAVANVRGNNKGVVPIAGIKEPNVAGKRSIYPHPILRVLQEKDEESWATLPLYNHITRKENNHEPARPNPRYRRYLFQVR